MGRHGQSASVTPVFLYCLMFSIIFIDFDSFSLCSCLRAGDFWYTAILFKSSSYILNCCRASGEAILDTQRYFSKQCLISFCSRLRRGDFRYTTILYQSTLSKHFIQALYQSFLSKHFIKAHYQGITKVLQRRLSTKRQGSSKHI